MFLPAGFFFINALSHGETIIGTGMKYFSKASKAILYSYYLLLTTIHS